jgi:hypothetical protein
LFETAFLLYVAIAKAGELRPGLKPFVLLKEEGMNID